MKICFYIKINNKHRVFFGPNHFIYTLYNEFIEAGFQEDSLDYDWRLFWKGKRYRKNEEDFINKENKGRKIFKCYSTGTMKLVLKNNQKQILAI